MVTSRTGLVEEMGLGGCRHLPLIGTSGGTNSRSQLESGRRWRMMQAQGLSVHPKQIQMALGGRLEYSGARWTPKQRELREGPKRD